MNPNACPRPEWTTTTNSIGDWLISARQQLTAVSETPLQEAQILLGQVLRQPRSFLLAHPERVLTTAEQVEARALLARRAVGEPLPYVLGHWEFYGLDFVLSPDVLIPRPETELMVAAALEWLCANPQRRRIADVGTGSGCIAVALGVHMAGIGVLAVDKSLPAMRIARKNIHRHGVDGRVLLAQMDLLSAVGSQFDLVCANLPYIPSGTVDGLAVARHEPRLALDGGADGLHLVERLLDDARRVTAPGGLLLLEIEAGQGESAPQRAHDRLPGAAIDLLRDLAGLPRLLRIQL